MKMLFKGHSTRLEMLIEKIHSNKESSCQDSEHSGSMISDLRPSSTDHLPELNHDSPKSQCFSDTEEEKDWDETRKSLNDSDDILKSNYSEDNGLETKCLQFSCPYCPRQFKHKRSRDRHIKLHTGDKKYKCIQCESAFARSDHLKIHMKTHEVKKQYKCHTCNKGYNTVSAYSFHEKSHKHDGMKNNCSDIYSKILSGSEESENSEIMQKPSMAWQSLQDIDSEDNADIKTICVYCYQLFSSTEQMNEHIQICHMNSGEKQKYDFKNESPTQEIFFDTDTQMEKKETNQRKKLKEDGSEKEKHHYTPSLNSQETFICSCCYERLPNFKSFLIHMETHVSTLKNKNCNHCDEDKKETFMLPLNNYLCCCHCNKFFEDSEKLQEHLVERHVMTFYKCSLCEQTFEDLLIMKAHLMKNHVTNREHFECNNCIEGPKLFHDRISAELHISKYHAANKTLDNWQERSRISLERNGNSMRDEYLKNYVNNSSVVPTTTNFRCAYCKEYRTTKNDLQLHLRTHQISEKSRHKCNICDETFTSSPELASHKLSHCKIIESNMCVPCKTIILDEESFVKHQLKHSDNSKSTAKLNLILPSICIVCGQTLQSDTEIELHAKFHLKFLSEQTRSPICKSPFPEEIVLSNNEKASMDFRGILDATLELQCHLCKKSFSDKEKLQVHLIEHNFFGINQFSCYVCSSVFTGAAGLQSHLSNHNLAEKPYQCSVCSAGFFFRAELDNHKYLHSFKLQFDCLSDDSISQARNFTSAWVDSEISTSETR